MIENKQNVNGYGIRLHKVVLQDFKNIHNGEVVIDPNKDGADFASQADIIQTALQLESLFHILNLPSI